MDKQSMEFKKRIYDLMNGSLDLVNHPVPEGRMVKNEFAEGEACGELYRQIYEANGRICEKLGEREDRDVEIIIDSFMEITERMCLKMYDYGGLFETQ